MKQKILNTITHPLISGTIIVFVGTFAGSVLNFLFNLFMSRNLSVADYGVLASMSSIVSLSVIVTNSVVPMVVTFAAEYFAKKEYGKVRGLFFEVSKGYAIIGLLIFLSFLMFPTQIGQFFNIHSVPIIILVGFIIFVIFIATVNNALLQAKLAFGYISFLNFISAVAKLLIGVLLFFLGWEVMGGMWAIFAGFITMYILSFIPIRFIFSKKLSVPKLNIKELLGYGIPAAVALFSLTAFITTDLLLVKHFFTPSMAGIYAGISLVGKVIFFLTAPIGTVMFPLIVQRHAKKERYTGVFLLSLLMVLLPSLAITAFYFLFPAFSIQIFIKKKEYLLQQGLLGPFGIFITLYSLLNVTSNFFLSIKKIYIWIPIFFGALVQGVLIWFYHQSFMQVVTISIYVSSGLLFVFFMYYIYLYKHETS